jgi:cellobiose phosphorylase
MSHFILHFLLGIRREAGKLYLKPCIPAAWPSFRVKYRHGSAWYLIEVTHTHTGAEQMRLVLDDVPQDTPYILLQDDGQEHRAEIALPAKRSRKAVAATGEV